MEKIYLDNGALKKPDEKVLRKVTTVLKNNYYNPNSVYEDGLQAKDIVEETKQIIANEINCETNELTFCSCGSEANALATVGYIRANRQKNFKTSVIEHSSISECPYAKKVVAVDENGFFCIQDVEKIKNSLVSLQMANSEIGTIQNIKKMVQILHSNNCIVHTDAVAAFGKLKMDVKDLDVDMLTATGQKVGGLIGSSFLYKKEKIKLEPYIWGHSTLRGGTPNVVAISAMGEAVKEFRNNYMNSTTRDYVCFYVLNNIPDCSLVGASLMSRLVDNLCLYFKGVKGDALVLMLDSYGIQVSTGSACNNYVPTPSSTLLALGYSEDEAQNIIRLTFNGKETVQQLDYVNETLKNCVQKIRLFS